MKAGMDENAEEPSSPFSTKLKIELVMLLALAAFTGAELVFRERFIALIEPLVGKIALIIAVSIGAALPGIAYKGEEWYRKLFSGQQFSTREKVFLVFLLEIAIAIAIAVAAQSLILKLFPQYIKYIWILVAEWFLLLYVFFTRVRHYGFPWFYIIATNIILAMFAYVTYRFV
jgi:hypothetical protein